MRYFDSDEAMPSVATSLRRKLDVLLTWGAAAECGDYRPYVAATLLHQWMEVEEGRAPLKPPDRILQAELLHWLDNCTTATDHVHDMNGIAILYGELVRRELFDYSDFVRTLVARGETARRDSTVSRL